jgi:hypothetical protein
MLSTVYGDLAFFCALLLFSHDATQTSVWDRKGRDLRGALPRWRGRGKQGKMRGKSELDLRFAMPGRRAGR